MERIRSIVGRALPAGIVVLLFCAAAQLFSHATAPAAAEAFGGPTMWEYAELEFVGVLPDAYSSYSDYRDPVWQWSSAEDGVLRKDNYVAAIKEIHEALTGYALGSSIKDGQLLVVLLLDAIGTKGWELAGYDERAIPVNYAGLFHAGNQVSKKWVFKRLTRGV